MPSKLCCIYETIESEYPIIKKKDKIVFTIDCNYFLFLERSELVFYNSNYKKIKTVALPHPTPSKYELRFSELPEAEHLYYQLKAYDKQGKEDRRVRPQ